MRQPLKLCVITGSRAEYGLLYWVMRMIQAEDSLQLQLIATGMHLSPEFGLTYQQIENDGFVIDAKIETLLSSDSAVGIAKSMGLGVISFAEAFSNLKPHMIIVLGDRYEILAAVQAALIAKVPVAHIAGGDTTEGAFDESIRHAITKMSHLHFVTNSVAAERVRQMGENPSCIFNVGSPGIDQAQRLPLLAREQLEKELDFSFCAKNLLITFHPVTLEFSTARQQFQELLDALDQLGSNVGLLFTKPNADTDGRILIAMIDDYVKHRSNAKAFVSLGQLRYLSVMSLVDAVVGNSSSGLYEAPTFKKPTVNIGDRQKGRLKASSVLDCAPNAADIAVAINTAFELDCSHVVNPYGDGNSSARIVDVLKNMQRPQELLKKHFYDLG